MAQFYITAISTTSFPKHHISRVLLHETVIADGVLSKGKVYSKDQVVRLIEAGNSVSTATWSYGDGNWKNGAEVEILHERDGTKYLRSGPDHSVLNNLLHLLPLEAFV